MKKIIGGNHTKLDDNVSFQLVRTNPVLTTNVKLMYDGSNMFFESYNINDDVYGSLNIEEKRINPNSYFNYDIVNYWNNKIKTSSDNIYDSSYLKHSTDKYCDDENDLFENMYWGRIEKISPKYGYEYGCISPLYIKDKLPDHFVIFRLDGVDDKIVEIPSDIRPNPTPEPEPTPDPATSCIFYFDIANVTYGTPVYLDMFEFTARGPGNIFMDGEIFDIVVDYNNGIYTIEFPIEAYYIVITLKEEFRSDYKCASLTLPIGGMRVPTNDFTLYIPYNMFESGSKFTIVIRPNPTPEPEPEPEPTTCKYYFIDAQIIPHGEPVSLEMFEFSARGPGKYPPTDSEIFDTVVSYNDGICMIEFPIEAFNIVIFLKEEFRSDYEITSIHVVGGSPVQSIGPSNDFTVHFPCYLFKNKSNQEFIIYVKRKSTPEPEPTTYTYYFKAQCIPDGEPVSFDMFEFYTEVEILDPVVNYNDGICMIEVPIETFNVVIFLKEEFRSDYRITFLAILDTPEDITHGVAPANDFTVHFQCYRVENGQEFIICVERKSKSINQSTNTLVSEYKNSEIVEVNNPYTKELFSDKKHVLIYTDFLYSFNYQEILSKHGLTLDMFETHIGLNDNEYYRELKSRYSDLPVSSQLTTKDRFENDIKISSEISQLVNQILNLKGDVNEKIVEYWICIQICYDRLYNKNIDPQSQLVQMAYYCYSHNIISIYERIIYYNSIINNMQEMEFEKYGSKLEMVVKVENILKTYNFQDKSTPDDYFIKINNDDEIEVVGNKNNILKKASIVKVFNLKDDSTLGSYLRKYMSQSTFVTNKPMMVDNEKHDIYYYGIDLNNGGLTKKSETYASKFVNNDTTLLDMDEYFTLGYKRNNLIFPYIINLEYMFTDHDENASGKYFGMYCNEIDLYEIEYKEISDVKNTNFTPQVTKDFTTLRELPSDTINDTDNSSGDFLIVNQVTNPDDLFYSDGDSLFYIKDRKENIYKLPQHQKKISCSLFKDSNNKYSRANKLINRYLKDDYEFDKLIGSELSEYNNQTFINYVNPSDVFNWVEDDDLFGLEPVSTTVECQRVDVGDGYESSLSFTIDDNPYNGSSICIKVINNNLNGFVANEIHLTAKDKKILHIHDLYFGEDKPYDDGVDDWDLDSNLGSNILEEQDNIVFGDASDNKDTDDFGTDLFDEENKNILSVEGDECPFLGVGIIYKKEGVATVPKTFLLYDVTYDNITSKIICTEQKGKRIDRTTVYKEETINELLGKDNPYKEYVRVFDRENDYTQEVRIYGKKMLFGNQNVGSSSFSEGEVIIHMVGTCPFKALGLVYNKHNSNLPISYVKYDVTHVSSDDGDKFRFKVIDKLDKTTLYVKETIKEFWGEDEPSKYIRMFADTGDTITELRVYDPGMYLTDVDGKYGDASVTGSGEIYLKITGDCPFSGVGICRNSSGKVVKYIKYKVNFKDKDMSTLNCIGESEHTDTNNIGVENMIKSIFSCDVSKYIRANTNFDGYDVEIRIFLPKVEVSYPSIDNSIKGAFDKADLERFKYILRGDNYKNLFILEDMKPGTYHITRNKTIYYSCNGTPSDIAMTICDALNSYPYYAREIEAYRDKNTVVLKHAIKGSKYNGGKDGIKIEVSFDGTYIYKNKISFPTDRYNRNGYTFTFTGGADNSENTFLINTSQIDKIVNPHGVEKFIKTSKYGVYSRVKSINYYVDKSGNVDPNTCIMTTDENGKYIAMGFNRIQLQDRHYPKIGVLSFFPVKDFDFDMLFSIYGETTSLDKEFNSNGLSMSKFLTNINNEYDYFYEHLLKGYRNKLSPHISKWSYVNGKDSFENPYRLNMSKIFNINNLSANRNINTCDINSYVFNVPYFIIPKYEIKHKSRVKIKYDFDENMYQYITYGTKDEEYRYESLYEYIEDWKRLFLNLELSRFNEMFTNKNNKTHFKKYELIENGSVMFRGVKFNIENGDGYKFSLVNIPVYTSKDMFDNRIHFIKNDTCKFIVGMMFVPVYEENTFNLSYMYKTFDSSCSNISSISTYLNHVSHTPDGSIMIDDVKLLDVAVVNTKTKIDWNSGIRITSVLFDEILRHVLNYNSKTTKVELYLHNGESINKFDDEQYRIPTVNTISDISYRYNILKVLSKETPPSSITYGYENKVSISIKLTVDKDDDFQQFYSKLTDMCSEEYIKNKMKDKFSSYTIYGMSSWISGTRVEYISQSGDSFNVQIGKDSEQINVSDKKQSSINMSDGSYTIIDNPSGKDIVIKRHDGYFEPLFRNITYYKDMSNINGDFCFTNTCFDENYVDEYGEFGVMRNVYRHKYSEGRVVLTSDNPNDENYGVKPVNINIFS